MELSRRRFVAGAAGAGVAGLVAPAQAIMMLGIHPPKPEDVALANEIVSKLPKSDYITIMRALANLDKTGPMSAKHDPDGKPEPFNRRWKYYANPLLLRFWKDMGEPFTNDCNSFCGITLGWCLHRDGRKPPSGPESSQHYLNWGTPVTSPQLGDVVVYTHRKKPDHGHVGIFVSHAERGKIRVLGANQTMSELTTCGNGYNANVIDERSMTTSGEAELYFNGYRRPPART